MTTATRGLVISAAKVSGRGGHLPAAPLLEALRLRGVSLRSLGEARERAVHRAARSGSITRHLADELCVEVLDEHPAVVFGAAWWPPETQTCIRRPRSRHTTCRCPQCSQEMARLRERRRLRGGLPRVPATAAWRRLDELLAKGWTPVQIERAAGVGERLVENALSLRRTRGLVQDFGPVNAALLVRVDPDGPRPVPARVSALGARRRLQALAFMGWPLSTLDLDEVASQTMLAKVRSGEYQQLRPQLADAIAKVYRERCGTPGPSARTARFARKKKWRSPVYWADPDRDSVPARRARL